MLNNTERTFPSVEDLESEIKWSELELLGSLEPEAIPALRIYVISLIQLALIHGAIGVGPALDTLPFPSRALKAVR